MSFRFISLNCNQSYRLIGLYSHKHWAEPSDLFVSKLALLGNELFLFRVGKPRKKLFHLNKSVFHIPLHFSYVMFIAIRLKAV